jgi:pantoate--beta-alanine ligase
MRLVTTVAEIRQLMREKRMQGLTVGFVPTMGYLHEGHLSLVQAAKESCDAVVMSIFVNPLQFGPNEDFDRYPRDLERDRQLAAGAGVDVLFAPSVEEMYPGGQQAMLAHVDVDVVTEALCGATRPGHFRGVATVVTKLFNIVQPDRAFFGMKDAQQVAVIQAMVRDLNQPVEIVPCPTLREADGLAMSSRNVYLSPEEREQALVLNRSLASARKWVREGERDAERLKSAVRAMIEVMPLADVQYVEVVSMRDMRPVAEVEDGALLALAVKFGKTRLIDNTLLHYKG